MFFVGSNDETADNQLCQLFRIADGRYQLKVRVPDCLRDTKAWEYLVVDGITFQHDRASLDEALPANIAPTWRLYWDGRHCRAFFSFGHVPARQVTLDAQYGVVGIDFNVDHPVVTETDAFGNLLREDAISGHREPMLSDALLAAVP